MSTSIASKPDAQNKKRARSVSDETTKFLTRAETAQRWRCSSESVKRKQKAGLLNPIYLSQRKLLYRLDEIETLEANGATK